MRFEKTKGVSGMFKRLKWWIADYKRWIADYKKSRKVMDAVEYLDSRCLGSFEVFVDSDERYGTITVTVTEEGCPLSVCRGASLGGALIDTVEVLREVRERLGC